MRGEIEEMAEDEGEAAHPKGGGTELFHYHRQVGPMLWVFAALAFVELGVIHLLLWHWSHVAAYALDALSGAALLLILGLLLSIRSRPVELGAGVLRVRTGLLIDSPVPFDEIAFAQSGFAPADYMPGSLLKASLLAHPNVLVLLHRDIDLPGPLGRTRRVHAVALAVDEPARFLLALNTRVKRAAAAEEPPVAA
jgi:hypothetical protein